LFRPRENRDAVSARRILSTRAETIVRDDVTTCRPAQEIDGAHGVQIAGRNVQIGGQTDFVGRHSKKRATPPVRKSIRHAHFTEAWIRTRE
jgi:hypothetical protein